MWYTILYICLDTISFSETQITVTILISGFFFFHLLMHINCMLFIQVEDVLKKWRGAILRADREMTSDDRVCKLHFSPDKILTHNIHKMPDGTEFRMSRVRKALVDKAIPTILTNVAPYLSTYIKKRKALENRVPLAKKQRISKEQNVPTVDATPVPLFTFKDLVANLDKVCKPHTLWAVSSHGNTIVCVKWDHNVAAERQIIDDYLGFKI